MRTMEQHWMIMFYRTMGFSFAIIFFSLNSHIVNEILTQQACLKKRNKVLCETIKQTLHHPQYQRTFNFDMNNMMNHLFFRHKGNFKLSAGRFQSDSLNTQSYSKSSIMQQQTVI